MKRKKIYKKFSMLLLCLMTICFIGCSNKKTGNNGENEPAASVEPSTSADSGSTGSVASGSETGRTDNDNTASDNNQNNMLNNADANGAGTVMTGTPQASKANPINDKIQGYYSETVAYPLLESEIIDELDYEKQDMTKTRYYYNYVDLDGDNIDEIIVQLNGQYNTTKDGDTVVIVKQENTGNDKDDDDGFDIIAQYTAFTNPVIVSDNTTKGYRDLIFMNPDGTYKKVVYGKGGYQKMSEAKTLRNIDDVTGVALLCNDVASDTKNEKGLFFSK